MIIYRFKAVSVRLQLTTAGTGTDLDEKKRCHASETSSAFYSSVRFSPPPPGNTLGQSRPKAGFYVLKPNMISLYPQQVTSLGDSMQKKKAFKLYKARGGRARWYGT